MSLQYPQPSPPPAGYFELPTTVATIEGHIIRLDGALRHACLIREKAAADGDLTRWAINAQSMDQLLATRAALTLELWVLGATAMKGTP